MPRKKKEESTETAAKPKRKTTSIKKTKLKTPKAVKSPVKRAAQASTVAKSPRQARGASASLKLKSKSKTAWKPPQYGETQIVAFIRDPNCIFVYWEVASQQLAEVKDQLKSEYPKSRMLLRMFRERGDGGTELLYEVEVNPDSMNQYLPVEEPGFAYFVEVVRKTVSGKTVVIARSNTVSPPGKTFSRVIDSQWLPPQELMHYLSLELEGESHADETAGPGESVGGVSSAEFQRRRTKARESFSSFWGK
jgi:hypothetical protein